FDDSPRVRGAHARRAGPPPSRGHRGRPHRAASPRRGGAGAARASATDMKTRSAIILPTPDQLEAVAVAQFPALILELAAVQSAAAIRLRPRLKLEPETLLAAAEVAEALRMSEDWVAHAKLPFRVKIGGAVRYSAAGLARYQRAQADSRG